LIHLLGVFPTHIFWFSFTLLYRLYACSPPVRGFPPTPPPPQEKNRWTFPLLGFSLYTFPSCDVNHGPRCECFRALTFGGDQPPKIPMHPVFRYLLVFPFFPRFDLVPLLFAVVRQPFWKWDLVQTPPFFPITGVRSFFPFFLC